MKESESDFKLISDYLFEIGCCRICVLRFLNPNIDDFLDVENSLKSVNTKVKLNSFLCCSTQTDYRKMSQLLSLMKQQQRNLSPTLALLVADCSNLSMKLLRQ
jgi:hypothetical protein